MAIPGRIMDRTDLFVQTSVGVAPDHAVASLEHIRVCMKLDPEVAAERNAQIAALAAANTLGRTRAYVPRIHVNVPREIRVAANVPFLREGVSLRDELIRFLMRLAPFSSRPFHFGPADGAEYDETLVIGPGAMGGEANAVYAHYTGWTASVTLRPPKNRRTAHRDSNNPIGAMLAGTWAAAEILKRVFRRVKDPSVSIVTLSDTVPAATLSAWCGLNDDAVDGPDVPEEIDLGTFSIIGAGAIGGCLGFALRCWPRLRGTVHVCDFDKIELHSGNRLAVAMPEDVGKLKSAHLAATLAEAGLHARDWPTPFQAFARQVDSPGLERLLVGVDNEECRRDAAFEVPRLLINGGTIDAEFLVSTHVGPEDGPCLACLYPRSSVPPTNLDARLAGRPLRRVCGQAIVRQRAPSGTIAFLPQAAALLMLGELVKDRLGHPAMRRSSIRINMFRLPSSDEQIDFRPGRECLCRTDPYARRYRDKWQHASMSPRGGMG